MSRILRLSDSSGCSSCRCSVLTIRCTAPHAPRDTAIPLRYCSPLVSTGAGAKMNVTAGTVRFSGANQNTIGGDGLDSLGGRLEFTGGGKTDFSG